MRRIIGANGKPGHECGCTHRCLLDHTAGCRAASEARRWAISWGSAPAEASRESTSAQLTALMTAACSARVSRTTSPPGSASRCASSAEASRTNPAPSLTPRGRRCLRRRLRGGRLCDARRSAHPTDTGPAQARQTSHSCGQMPHPAHPPGDQTVARYRARHPSHQDTAVPRRSDRRLAGHSVPMFLTGRCSSSWPAWSSSGSRSASYIAATSREAVPATGYRGTGDP